MNIKWELENNYNVLKFEISELEYKLKLVDDEAMPSITPNYSGMPTGKGGTSDKVFDSVANIEKNKNKLLRQIEKRKARLNTLNNLISTQNKNAQLIIKQRAFERLCFWEISKLIKDTDGYEIYQPETIKKTYYKSLKNMQAIANNIEKEKGEN